MMDNYTFSLPNLILLGLSLSIAGLLTIGLKKANPLHVSLGVWRVYYIYLLGISMFCLFTIAGFFPNSDTFPPRFPLMFIYNFIFLFWVLFQRVDGSLVFLRDIPLHWLVYFQSFRIVLEMVLVMLCNEKAVPEEITLHGRSFDIIVGVGALAFGYLIQKRNALGIGIAFNVLGLASIVNIITIAIPSFPSPFRIYEVNLLPTYFPGILVPLFLAPVAIIIHVLSLKQLIDRRSRRSLG